METLSRNYQVSIDLSYNRERKIQRNGMILLSRLACALYGMHLVMYRVGIPLNILPR